jgi:UDP-glucose 4-epimerase
LSFGRVLVTGGAGFIGSHLVDELVSRGCGVTVLDNLSTGRIENLGYHLKNDEVNFVNGDVRDEAAVNSALRNVDTVYHLAALTSVPYSVRYPKVTHEANVEGTRNLLEACLRNNVERFVFVSTCAVYGEPKYLPIDEFCPPNPISPYAESKLRAEALCRSFSEKNGLETVVFRPFNIYGPRQRKDQRGGVISRFIDRLREGKPPLIYGDGEQTRDFLYVKDAVEAFVTALTCKEAVGETFNIATGVPTSINQLVHSVIELFSSEGIEPEYVDVREGDIKHSYADIGQARMKLGFKPRTSLKEGLLALVRLGDRHG